MIRFRNLFFASLRFLAIVISFTIDIKVRADVKFVAINGGTEIEKSGQISVVKAHDSLDEPLQFETFASASAKFYFNSVYVGVGSKCHIELLTTPDINIYKGKILIIIPEKMSLKDKPAWFKIHTPQSEMVSSGGEFSVQVENNKTALSILSGNLILTDRASGKKRLMTGGFGVSIGGLLSTGEHVQSPLSSISFVDALRDLRELTLLNNDEIQAQSDTLRPLWKKAVEFISETNQAQVAQDSLKLEQIQNSNKKTAERESRSEAELRLYFRAKTLGVPDENTKDPSDN